MMKKRTIFTTIFLVVLIFGCKDNNDITEPSPADRDKFIGSWAGSYECSDQTSDTLIVAEGVGDLEVKVTLHAQNFNPDTVDGELTEVNMINIPEQTIGGFSGTAEITYSDNQLSLSQSGLGLTCEGTGYMKF